MKMLCWLSKSRSLRTLGSNLSNSESQILTLSFLLLDSLPYNADPINIKWFKKQPALDVFLPLNYIFIQCKIVQWLESVFALAKSTVGKMQVYEGLLQILSKELSMQDTCDDTFLFITICLYFYVCVWVYVYHVCTIYQSPWH